MKLQEPYRSRMQTFVDHLRTTDDTQCRSNLRVDVTQPDGTIQRQVCAEGALVDVALKLGLTGVSWQPRTFEPVYDRTVYQAVADGEPRPLSTAPPVVNEFMVGRSTNYTLTAVWGRISDTRTQLVDLVTLNDTYDMSFSGIADAVARYYELDQPTGRPTDAVADAG